MKTEQKRKYTRRNPYRKHVRTYDITVRDGVLYYKSQNRLISTENGEVPYYYSRELTPEVVRFIAQTRMIEREKGENKYVYIFNDIRLRMLTRWVMGEDDVLTFAPGDPNYKAYTLPVEGFDYDDIYTNLKQEEENGTNQI